MIATVHKGGGSFKGVVDYCLSEGRAREDERGMSAARTRPDGWRGARHGTWRRRTRVRQRG